MGQKIVFRWRSLKFWALSAVVVALKWLKTQFKHESLFVSVIADLLKFMAFSLTQTPHFRTVTVENKQSRPPQRKKKKK